ncbi:MAG: N-6 DNA methylase [Methanoregula sp.]|nr:N-6 DNA methylase [Methanoregula sp.]
MIKLLTPDGMLALIVPQRMLAVREDAQDRVDYVKNDKIESVVRLPSSFSYGAGIELYLITIRAEKLPATKNKILFIDLADFLQYVNEKEISYERVVEIVEKHRNFTLGLPGQKEIVLTRFSRVVSTGEVEKSNFILTIQRYVSPQADRIDIKEGYLELQRIQKKKGELEMEMDSCLKDIVKKMNEV